MTPNYASALMLNNLVKSYNISLSSTDYAESTVEYCLAINNENSLKLNYGLSYLDPSKPEMMKNILVFGKGLIYNSDSRVELPNETDNQFGFSASDICASFLLSGMPSNPLSCFSAIRFFNFIIS